MHAQNSKLPCLRQFLTFTSKRSSLTLRTVPRHVYAPCCFTVTGAETATDAARTTTLLERCDVRAVLRVAEWRMVAAILN
jgi:hypothetical protein